MDVDSDESDDLGARFLGQPAPVENMFRREWGREEGDLRGASIDIVTPSIGNKMFETTRLFTPDEVFVMTKPCRDRIMPLAYGRNPLAFTLALRA